MISKKGRSVSADATLEMGPHGGRSGRCIRAMKHSDVVVVPAACAPVPLGSRLVGVGGGGRLFALLVNASRPPMLDLWSAAGRTVLGEG